MGHRLDREGRRLRSAAPAEGLTAPAARWRPGRTATDAAAPALGWGVAALVPLAFLAVFFVWPVAALVGRGFFPDGAFTLAGFREVFSADRTWRIVGQTLTQGVLGVVFCVLLGVPGAYVLYRTRFPGRALVRAIVTIPFVLPTVVVGVAFKTLLAASGPLGFLGLDETLPAIVLALVFFNYTVVVRTVGGMWAGLDPRQADAAAALGASPARVLWTVTLPALAPAIASASAVVFLFSASAYGVVMVLGGVRYGTVESEIWFQTTQMLNLEAAAALSIVQLVIVTISLLVAQRLQLRQQRALRLRSDDTGEPAWRARRDWLPTAVTALVIGGLLLAPQVNLLVRSFATRDGWGLRHYELLLTTAASGVTVPVWQAGVNSLGIALAATAIAIPLGLLVSLLVSRRPRTPWARAGLRVLDSFFMLPLGVSAVTVGFGFLITLNRPPLDLRSSVVLVPIAQAVVALPMVVRVLLPVLRAIDPRLREAAATLGAGPWRVLRTIDLAMVARGLGLAVGFAFATSLGEFGATSFLARPDRPTLPVVIYQLIGRPGSDNFGMAMAASVLLAAVTAAVMLLAERMRPQEATGW